MSDRPWTREDMRAALLAADDITIKAVPTPEWPAVDGLLHVRSMSAAQRERYLDTVRSDSENENGRIRVVLADSGARLAVYTLCDPNGELLFEASPEDVTALGRKSYVALRRIVDLAAALNGLDEKAEEAAKNGLASAATSVLSIA